MVTAGDYTHECTRAEKCDFLMGEVTFAKGYLKKILWSEGKKYLSYKAMYNCI